MKVPKAYLLATVSGCLLGLAWNAVLPSVSLFFAFIPLLFVFRNTTFHYKQAFNFGFISFLIFHLGTVWWLSISSFFGFMAIILSNSIAMALVWMIAYRLRQILGFTLGLISFVILWLTFEYIHYNWELSWPFMNLGNWLGQLLNWIQWYEYTGVLGGTLWIMLVNVILFLAINGFIKKKKVKSIVLGTVGILFFIVPIIISKTMFKNYKETGDKTRFLIIQPNIDPYTEKYDTTLYEKQIDRQIELAKEALTNEIDCCVFPESSFPLYLDENKISSDSFFQNIDNELISRFGATVIGGLYSYQLNGKDTLFYNTAFMMNEKKEIQLYHKSKLVIGVEKMPFQKYFRFLKNWNLNFGGYTTSLTEDTVRAVFNSPSNNLKVAPIICYESVYGQFVSEFINNGANCIVVITNDAWWGDTPGYKQHLMHSQLRAIETRTAVVRSANTGISCFINQKGEMIKQVESWNEKVLEGSILTNTQRTFYSKHGDFIGEIAIYSSIVLIILGVIYAFYRKYNQNSTNNQR